MLVGIVIFPSPHPVEGDLRELLRHGEEKKAGRKSS